MEWTGHAREGQCTREHREGYFTAETNQALLSSLNFLDFTFLSVSIFEAMLDN
jgi:hypothetical protein